MLRKFLHFLILSAVITSNFAINKLPVFADTAIPAYNIIATPTPYNAPSIGYEATSTNEFGDQVHLGGTSRSAASATILMSNWAAGMTYPSLLAANANGYMHPITLNIYQVGALPNVGVKIASVTQNFLIPWLPQNDPTCDFQQSPVRKWRAPDGNCYNGIAFPITFDLTGITLPDEFVFGVAYNTQHYGYNPIGTAGPYNSLNVGTSSNAPTIGADVEPDAAYWNSTHAGNYSDGGSAGVGIFRRDTGWTGYAPAATFNVIVPASLDALLNRVADEPIQLTVQNTAVDVKVVSASSSANTQNSNAQKTYDIVLSLQNIAPPAAPAVLASLNFPDKVNVVSITWSKEGQYYPDNNLPRTCKIDLITAYCGIGTLWSGMKAILTLRITAEPGTYSLGFKAEDLSTLYEVPYENHTTLNLKLN